MLAAIQFDDQKTLQTDKVDDIAANRFLSLELQPHEAMTTQVIPEPGFGIPHVGTQMLGVFAQCHVSLLAPAALSPGPSPINGRGVTNLRRRSLSRCLL